MNSYRIEKVRCPVTVVFAGGGAVSGEIFLNPTSRFRAEPQAPAEFLNEEDEYFALASPEQPPLLVAKASVESIEIPGEPGTAMEGIAPNLLDVELRLSSGAILAGAIRIDTPPTRARLLDFLNSQRERFLRVDQPTRVILVNRRAIAHVHEAHLSI